MQFTMELEKGRALPFLDTLLTRKDGRKINISVYRKSTHRPVLAFLFTASSTGDKRCSLMPIPQSQDYGHRRKH